MLICYAFSRMLYEIYKFEKTLFGANFMIVMFPDTHSCSDTKTFTRLLYSFKNIDISIIQKICLRVRNTVKISVLLTRIHIKQL